MLDLIKRGESGWEEDVPEAVSTMIKDRCLFGFPCVVIPGGPGPDHDKENQGVAVETDDVYMWQIHLLICKNQQQK